MRYLLIAVFVFIVGCSNLTEEIVYKYELDEVSTKYFDGALRYKYKVEQIAPCNKSENIYRWKIYFEDKDGFDLADTYVYRDLMTIDWNNDCILRGQGSITMKPNTYKQITTVAVSEEEKD